MLFRQTSFWNQIRKCAVSVDKNAELFTKRVVYRGGKSNQEISIDAIYQDTDPSGGGRAVVFAQHGAPGSHKDFKYIIPALKERNIRVIAINYPGNGFTPNDQRLSWENEERNNFANSILNSLDLREKKLIFLGHSRGGENSLQLGVHHIENCIGIVMLNCPGLRMHRGIRPYWPLKLAMELVSIQALQPIMFPIAEFIYNKIGLRVPNGEVAAISLLNLRTFAFEKQRPLAELVSKHPTIKLLYGFGGNDFLIERENSEELAACFEGRYHVECYTKDDPHDDERVKNEVKEKFLTGNRLVTAYFHKEDHFLQKHRATTVIEAIDAMISHHEQSN